jgi:hypothetical protein
LQSIAIADGKGFYNVLMSWIGEDNSTVGVTLYHGALTAHLVTINGDKWQQLTTDRMSYVVVFIAVVCCGLLL